MVKSVSVDFCTLFVWQNITWWAVTRQSKTKKQQQWLLQGSNRDLIFFNFHSLGISKLLSQAFSSSVCLSIFFFFLISGKWRRGGGGGGGGGGGPKDLRSIFFHSSTADTILNLWFSNVNLWWRGGGARNLILEFPLRGHVRTTWLLSLRGNVRRAELDLLPILLFHSFFCLLAFRSTSASNHDNDTSTMGGKRLPSGA